MARKMVSDPIYCSRPRPVLLWLAAGFWLVLGISGIISTLLIIPNIPQLPPRTLFFVLAAALSHVLSIWGGIFLLLRRKAAIVLLTAVFILTLITLLVYKVSPSALDFSTFIIWVTAGATIVYALLLRQWGELK